MINRSHFYHGTLMTERTFWMGEQSLKATSLSPGPLETHRQTDRQTTNNTDTDTNTRTETHDIISTRSPCFWLFSFALFFRVCAFLRQPSHPAGAPSDERTAAGPGRHSWRPWVVEQGRAGGVTPALPRGGMWLRRWQLSRYAYPVCTRAPSGP